MLDKKEQNLLSYYAYMMTLANGQIEQWQQRLCFYQKEFKRLQDKRDAPEIDCKELPEAPSSGGPV